MALRDGAKGDEISPFALSSVKDAEPQDDAMQTARRPAYRDTSSHRAGPSAVGARKMARRPLEGTSETSVQRLARRAEEDRQEIRDGFAAIQESIETIRSEIRQGAQNTGQLERRFDNLEWQVNLTRDEVQRRAVNPAPSQIKSAKTAINDAAKTWQAKAIAAGIAILTFLSLLNNIPDAQRVVEKFWTFTRELDQPAAPVAKTDDKH